MRSASIGILFVLGMSQAQAAPFYRVWRGYQRADLTRAQVDEAVRSRLGPMTPAVGAGKGLVGYVPAIPEQAPGAADEVALVVYESEQAYRGIRSTPQGQAYGDLHWEMFDRKRSSSLVPEIYFEQVQIGKAYDLWGSNPDWQRGAVRVTLALRREGTSDSQYIRAIERLLDEVVSYNRAMGFEALVVGVDAHQLTMFELFSDQSSLYDIAHSSRYERAYSNLERVLQAPLISGEALRQQTGNRIEIPTGGAVQVLW
jgi:hypothetical protein